MRVSKIVGSLSDLIPKVWGRIPLRTRRIVFATVITAASIAFMVLAVLAVRGLIDAILGYWDI
jgi:hypothetical protein